MKEKESRTIYCPVCHRGRILDAASQTDPAHLRLFGPRQSAKAEWFTKCPKCGAQIGMIFQREVNIEQQRSHRVRSLTGSFLAMCKAPFLLSFSPAERRKGFLCLCTFGSPIQRNTRDLQSQNRTFPPNFEIGDHPNEIYIFGL